MKIIIDGDACPNIKQIEELSKKYNIEICIVSDTTHNIESDYAKIIIVDKGSQNADMKIASISKQDDIVITSDYGLAVMCLAKNSKVLSPSGIIYNSSNIDGLLELRHLKSKIRKSGVHLKGPKKRTKNDVSKFLKILESLIREVNNK